MATFNELITAVRRKED